MWRRENAVGQIVNGEITIITDGYEWLHDVLILKAKERKKGKIHLLSTDLSPENCFYSICAVNATSKQKWYKFFRRQTQYPYKHTDTRTTYGVRINEFRSWCVRLEFIWIVVVCCFVVKRLSVYVCVSAGRLAIRFKRSYDDDNQMLSMQMTFYFILCLK